jgi:ribonuclease HI
MAEYEGLLAGLRAAVRLGVHYLLVKVDSQLVVNQVSKKYQSADPQMAAYVAEVRCTRAPLAPGVFEEKLCQPTITAADRVEGGTPPSSRGN